MYLTCPALPSYLSSRGTIDPACIVDGQFTATEEGRRNRNYRVLESGGRGLFVKQVPMAHMETIGSLHREAACYQLAGSSPNFASLRGVVPELLDYDPLRHTLTTRLLADSHNLHTFYGRAQRHVPRIGELLGQHISRYHADWQRMLSDPRDLIAFPKGKPWILSMVRSAESIMPNMSPGCQEVVRALRSNPGFGQHFDAIHGEWTPFCLMHGDLKWDNFLIAGDPDAEQDLALHLVDWELADIGDPGWDVGCVFSGFLQHLAIEVTGDGQAPTANALTSDFGPRLDELRHLLAAFWNAYAAGVALPADQKDQVLLRCVRFAGVRLAQGAFEMMQGMQMQTLSPAAGLVIQLSLNTLTDPAKTGGELMGLARA